MNYVGKLLEVYVRGDEKSFVFGTPRAHVKDAKLVNEINDNIMVCPRNKRYANKFALKIQEWISLLKEGNAHKVARQKTDGVPGVCLL